MRLQRRGGRKLIMTPEGAAAPAPKPRRDETLINATDLHNYNTVHFAEGTPENRAGELHVGDAPGLGVTVDADRLGPPVAVIGEPRM